MADSVADRISKLVKEKGMTIKGLSNVTGIPLNTLYSITKRKSNRIHHDNLVAIATALNVDENWLMYGFELDEDKIIFTPYDEKSDAPSQSDIFDLEILIAAAEEGKVQRNGKPISDEELNMLKHSLKTLESMMDAKKGDSDGEA